MRLSLDIPALALKVTYPSNTDSTLLKNELLPEAEQSKVIKWFLVEERSTNESNQENIERGDAGLLSDLVARNLFPQLVPSLGLTFSTPE